MPVRRIHAHPKLEENRGRVALMRGPVVYAFEGVDNPGLDLFEVELPVDARLNSEHRPDLLNGVTVVRATAMNAEGKPVTLTGIPYYAWANRHKMPMNLWLKEALPEDDLKP
ncbi:hypothetical protein MLD59_21430, partial [Verrucomicrobiaceae bacterium E54]|nr:hypothetical protein [Verrucomicrobiaceae bacterium E54]